MQIARAALCRVLRYPIQFPFRTNIRAPNCSPCINDWKGRIYWGWDCVLFYYRFLIFGSGFFLFRYQEKYGKIYSKLIFYERVLFNLVWHQYCQIKFDGFLLDLRRFQYFFHNLHVILHQQDFLYFQDSVTLLFLTGFLLLQKPEFSGLSELDVRLQVQKS